MKEAGCLELTAPLTDGPNQQPRLPSVPHAQLTLRLCLSSWSELSHPLLRQARCSELVLPEAPLPEPPALQRGQLAAAAAEAAAVAAAEAEAAVVLLSSTAFQQRSGASLTALVNLPARAAALAPRLLHAYPRLTSLGLQAAHEWDFDIGSPGVLAPGFFPPGLQRLQASAGRIEGLHWLPDAPLAAAHLSARCLRLMEAHVGPLACTHLSLTGEQRLTASVEALRSLEACTHLALSAPAGDLLLRPLPADESSVWAWLPGPVFDYGLPAPALLAKWLRVLAPLLAEGRPLRSLAAGAQRFFLMTHNHDWAYADPGMEVQLLAPLPPPADGACPAPWGTSLPPLAVDAAEGGLAASLRSHAPGAPPGTCQLAILRERAASAAAAAATDTAVLGAEQP